MKLFAKLAVAVVLAMPLTASACPLCREAIDASDGSSAHDPDRLARAYNYTIYGFIGMPVLLMSGLGLLIYRSYRNAPQSDLPPIQ
ncbi:MAG: hypothetical protein ACJ8F7_00890 [Gemmataceae bacterium]